MPLWLQHLIVLAVVAFALFVVVRGAGDEQQDEKMLQPKGHVNSR